MTNSTPNIGEKLSAERTEALAAVSKSCRRTIISMLKQSQSGHPGGSLSSLDYLTLLYSNIISRTGEKIVVSHGHISPAVYAILAEFGYIPKEDVIKTFRQIDSPYEGHVTRHVKGVYYGTGPLGIGVSVGAAFALAEKLNGSDKKVFALMGDGEAQEGQVYEMMHFAKKYNLNNLILFVDYNEVQLTASLKEIMDIDLPAVFKSAGWNVIETDGHDFEKMWHAISNCYQSDKPNVIIGKTIMGKGVDYMEEEGKNLKATWHGNAPKPDDADKALSSLELSPEEQTLIKNITDSAEWAPGIPDFVENLTPIKIETGDPVLYTKEDSIDSRTAYGKALLDLAHKNPQIRALSADLRGSNMTKYVAEELEKQHIEAGIAEQNMVSVSGGLSLAGFIPFCSTFGAFMTSRAKDQARVNDINKTNVKMVATHCGLSVGEDGPTHQAIDDMSSFMGFYNTNIIEPADPNQCDRIIRYIASHWGNFYVRMGRHKYPVITKTDGTPFYGKDYQYEYGKSDIIRAGNDLTIAAGGAMVYEALAAWEMLKIEHPELSVELVAVSSIKKFDHALIDSIKRTKKVLTVEDHNVHCGLSAQLARQIASNNMHVELFESLGVREYQLSGKSSDLYSKVGLSSNSIAKKCLQILQK